MDWSEFEAEEPRLAVIGRRLLEEPGVVLVVTIRVDGSPRWSPVEPLLWKGRLWLSMGWRSTKAIDLFRDDRVLVHSIVTDREGTEGEFKLRGRAVLETDRSVEEDYAVAMKAQAGWEPEPGRFHLFRIDVEDVTFIRWDPATNDQYVAQWPAGREFVRRGTSATSLGDREPVAFLSSDPSS
jgi:hypothetical protein